MPSSKRKLKEEDEKKKYKSHRKKEHHKREHKSSHQEIKTKNDQFEKKVDKPFRLGQLNSSVITAKRITVGVKGIFGNAKTSSSVYRDLQDRIEKKKYSKAVASEIELSLSRIVPSRSHDRHTDKSNSCPRTFYNSSFHTPGDTSTPINKDIHKSRSIGSFVARSVSSSSSISPVKKTPQPLQTQYVQIANSIRSAIPRLKLFNDKDYLKDVKCELKKIHLKKCSLTVIPKFKKEEFSQPTVCSETRKKTPDSKVSSQASEKPATGVSSQASDHPATDTMFTKETEPLLKKQKPNHVATTSSPPFSFHPFQTISTSPKHDFVLHDIQLDEKPAQNVNMPTDEKPPEECRNTIETSPFSHTERHVISHISNVFNQKHDISHLNRTTRHCNRPDLGDFPHPSVLDNDYFTKFSQPNIQTILSQPINTLRCNRRRSNRTLECNNDEIIKSDFLDYIDSIPIHALENELFGGESRRRIGTFSQDSNMVSLELVKPTMKSPSPPKLYRMNMY